MKGGFYLLPQTHKIIANLIYDDVYTEHNVKLNKTQLVYGSIKPDIYSGMPKLKHFKPQSFSVICNDISALSSSQTENNRAAIARLSQKIGVVTHYVADYFCVPHNDRSTYQHHIINHIQYENQLHLMYKETNLRKTATIDQWLDFSDVRRVMNYLDQLHNAYSNRNESLLNDLNGSLQASRTIATMIVQQAFLLENTSSAAA